MGNLFGGVSQKEPTALEECDSTWETDSGGEEEEDEDEDQSPSSTQAGQQQQQQGDEEEEEEEAAAAAAAGESAEPGTGSSTPQSDLACEQTVKPKRSFYAARDLYRYRHQYQQNFKDLRGQNELCNLRFYLNKIPLKPDGVYIEEILNKWKGDYEKLEHNHTYIQWLFPLREQGLNFYAKELTTYEIEEFKKTKEAIPRFLQAYKMMLEFFGIKLLDKSGKVTRAANWQERFQHLNESQHNYLRITRILKSLGELGYESFKVPLVKIFLHEALVENTIPNIKQSALEYFVYTIRDRRERRKLLRFAGRHYHPADHFIWGPPAKSHLDESNALVKPGSPCALTIYSKSRNTHGTSPSCSPKVKTPSHQGTIIEKKDVLKDSPHSKTFKEEVSQRVDTKKDGDNQNCKSEETRDCLDATDPICLAQKVVQNHETVSQQPENPENENKLPTEDISSNPTLDLTMDGESTPLSVELMPEDPKIS